MTRILLTIYSLFSTVLWAFADYSDRGRPWDADDNYDSSRGLWFAVGIVIVLIVIGIGAFAKHTWDNHKSQVKDGLGTIALFGGCILLFLAGKTCSESSPKDNGNAINVHQIQQSQTPIQSSPKTAPQHNTTQHQPQLRYRTEYYDVRCSRCNGSGSVVCTYCGGKGYLTVTCSQCGGKGSFHVKKGGRNFLTDEWETYETDEMCVSCFGKGVTETRCNHCNSEYPYGNHLISTYMTCPSCHGQGIYKESRQVPYYE